MVDSERQHTDASSIKPVSSLKSHFENIAQHGSRANDAAAREGAPQLRLPQSHGPGRPSRPSSRLSIDLSEGRNLSAHGELVGVEGARDHLRPPGRPAQRSPTPIDTSFQPFTSTSPLPSPYPLRSATPDNTRSSTLSSTVRPKPGICANQLGSDLSTPPSRRPSDFITSSEHVRARAYINDTLPERPKSSVLPEAESTSAWIAASDSSRTRQPHLKPSSVPPPINRADKPKLSGTLFPPQPSGGKSLPGLALSSSPGENRVSPFGTPPSSDEAHGGYEFSLAGQDRTVQESKQPGRPTTAQPAIYEPPPKHHSVAQKLRDQRNAGGDSRTSTTSYSFPSSPTSSTYPSVISPESRPVVPPRRDRNVGSRPRPTGPARTQSASPSPYTGDERRPSTTVPVPAPSAMYPPPPKRTGTIESTTRNDALPKPARPSEEGRRIVSTPVPISTSGIIVSHRPAIEDEDIVNQPNDPTPQSLSEYPDSSHANRRRPFFRHGPYEIHTKHDTRLFAMCGDYLCCTGHTTKVWNTADGELRMSLTLGEGVRVTSLAFKSAANPDDEGRWLWLGTNHGEIQEIDILNQTVAFVKTSAHPRREVIKIHRHANEMWSLDDEGKLHLWPSDETGSPNLGYSHHAFRVPKGHSFSLVVVDQLWLATGKDIRIFRPSSDPNVQFDVLAKPLCQASAGEVTSGAMIGRDPGKVFFGHIDGKVTIYSRHDYSCLGIVSVSGYKINSLGGAGEYLWAAFNTGMLYVYETRTTPWTVKKDWHAHVGPVVDIFVDHTSVWKLDRLQVASLGADNYVRIWDGMLQDDWLESAMHEQDVEFCDFREITALITTWNIGACIPQNLRHDEQDRNFFRKLLQGQAPPDILVFGFQELVDLEDKKVTAKSLFRSSKKKDAFDHEHMSRQYRAWRDHLSDQIEEHLSAQEPYELLHTASLVGLFTCIFVKASQREFVRNSIGSEVKRGMGGLHGNKGALMVRFTFDDSSLCFVNCHLAAGQTQTIHRNNDIAAILETVPAFPEERDPAQQIDLYVGGGDGTMILDHEICILNGDLNYRIDTIGRDAIINAVKANNLSKLLERDQLLLSRRKNPGFRLRAFQEAPITFAPTYKYDVGTDTYDTSEKRRAPAWCDRVLYRGLSRIKPVDYRRHEVRVSDHRPVSALFKIRVKRVSPKRRLMAWERCEQTWRHRKERLLRDAKLDFLVNVYGFNTADAERILHDRAKVNR